MSRARAPLGSAFLAALLLAGSRLEAQSQSACAAAGDPSLAELSARALRTATLEPERMRSILRRVRTAALLPHVQVHYGRGSFDYARNPDTLEPTYTSTESWRFDVAASFSLDRLVFDPHELRAAEVAARLSELRAHLLERIAVLWTARRELGTVEGNPPAEREAQARCAELTVALEVLTGRPLRSVSRPTQFSLPVEGPRR